MTTGRTTGRECAGGQPRLCRVTLYVDGIDTDLALPADVPVEVLIPAVHDTLIQQGLPGLSVLVARHLTEPGRSALDPSKTLWQNGMTDGAVLLLTPPALPGSRPPVIDAAATVAAAARAPAWLRQPAVARGAALAVAIVMAGLTGFLVVPGGPALPDVLLAATAVSAAAVLSTRMATATVSGALAAVACLGLLATSAALVGILCDLSAAQAGIGLTVLSAVLLTVANRLSVRVCGLSPVLQDGPERDPGSRIDGARRLRGALVAGAAAGAALGVLAACATESDWPRFLFATAVSAVLLLRLRHHPEALPSASVLAAGTLTVATALVSLHRQLPTSIWPLCLSPAVVGAAAIWLGYRPARTTYSAGSVRLLTAAEQLMLLTVIPLGCWNVGIFGAVRGWSLP